MGKIKVLSEKISNKIAAGEVVERPASVVKELIENSIDAEATAITVEIKNGGKTFIRVTDNGAGIAEDDTVIAFERHATSKIMQAEDLNKISTLGFRGEALASIGSVSQVELITKTKNDIIGTVVEVNGGDVIKKEEIGCPNGTTIIVRNLFYNTPARLKFLKKDSTEAGQISNHVERLALTHPEISFKFINNNRQVMHTPGNGDVLTTIMSVFGKEFAKSMLSLEFEKSGIRIQGFIGKSEISRSTRNYQCIFINGRYVKNKIISSAIDTAYKTLVTINKYPSVVLYIQINPSGVDVNVHPSKMEVRFDDEELIYNIVYEAVYNTLRNNILIPHITFEKHSENNNTNIEENNKKTVEIKDKELSDLFSNIKLPTNYPDYKQKQTITQPVVNESNQIYEVKNRFTSKPKNNIEKHSQNEILRPIEELQQEIELDLSFKIIGQLFSTYLIIESQDKMFLIDQHAAHERINYNLLIDKYKNGRILSQTLISPVVINLSLDEYNKAQENIELFDKIGFEVEAFGDNSFLMRSVPFVLDKNYSKEFFMEVIDLISAKKISNVLDLREDILHTMACKSAIKANDRLSDPEIKELIKDVLENKSTLTCPHGRPVIILITKYEIEKMFKRVQ